MGAVMLADRKMMMAFAGFLVVWSLESGFLQACHIMETEDKVQHLNSPNFPQYYDNDVDVCWVIKATSSGYRVETVFTFVNIQSSMGCSADFVEIRDGPNGTSPLIVKLCARDKPPGTILSTAEFMFIRFKTDSSIQSTGFRMVYHKKSYGCITVFASATRSLEIHYVDRGDKYSRDICWLIQHQSSSYVIVVSLHSTNLRYSQSCEDEYVEFQNVAGGYTGTTYTTLQRFCGDTMNTTSVRSTTQSMRVKLATYRKGSGFRFSYKAENRTGCQILLTDLKQARNLFSPNYPNYYDNDVDLCWIIKIHVLRDYNSPLKIRADFRSVDLQSSTDCYADSLEIRDGPNSTSPLIAKFCGRDRPDYISSTADVLYVGFKTNNNTYDKGFNIQYITEYVDMSCSTAFASSTSSRQIQHLAPDKPGWDRNVCWLIQHPSSSYIIVASVISSNLNYTKSCMEAFIDIKDGKYSRSPVLQRYCGDTKNIISKSSGQFMYIKLYTSSRRIERKATFTVSYKAKSKGVTPSRPTQNCENLEASKRLTRIRIPVYSSFIRYSRYADKCWVITTGSHLKDMKVRVFVKSIDLEEDCADHIELRNDNSSALLAKWCGSSIPPNVTSSGSSMYIRFMSDGTIQKKGFELGVLAVYTHDSLPGKTIAGIVIGSVVAVCVVCLGICYVKRRMSRSQGLARGRESASVEAPPPSYDEVMQMEACSSV